MEELTISQQLSKLGLFTASRSTQKNDTQNDFSKAIDKIKEHGIPSRSIAIQIIESPAKQPKSATPNACGLRKG